jgi:hypothetical protein
LGGGLVWNLDQMIPKTQWPFCFPSACIHSRRLVQTNGKSGEVGQVLASNAETVSAKTIGFHQHIPKSQVEERLEVDSSIFLIGSKLCETFLLVLD